MSRITGTTRLAGIIGDPVRHSLSPALHNTAYEALGLDWVFLAFEVPAGGAPEALRSARGLGLVGCSVTMPHKRDAAVACDACSSTAARLGSVNTVTVEPDGSLAGDSTDGEGFLRSLRDAGVAPSGLDAVVLGAGGAARAVSLALGDAGATVTITARRPEAAQAAAERVGAEVWDWDARDDAAGRAGLVVNATPLGMGDDHSLPVAAAALHAGQVVADLVYHPLQTPLLEAAAARGATTVDGLGMLVHQAALQIERWSGRAAPVDEMRTAALVELASR